MRRGGNLEHNLGRSMDVVESKTIGTTGNKYAMDDISACRLASSVKIRFGVLEEVQRSHNDRKPARLVSDAIFLNPHMARTQLPSELQHLQRPSIQWRGSFRNTILSSSLQEDSMSMWNVCLATTIVQFQNVSNPALMVAIAIQDRVAKFSHGMHRVVKFGDAGRGWPGVM